MSVNPPGRRRARMVGAAVLVAAGATFFPAAGTSAYADVQVSTEHVTGSDGKDYSVTNHLVPQYAAKSTSRKEWLLVWAGDENIADTIVPDVKNLPGTLGGGLTKVRNALPEGYRTAFFSGGDPEWDEQQTRRDRPGRDLRRTDP